MAGQFGPLIDLNLTARFEDSIASLTSFTTAARNALAAAQFDVNPSDRLTVVVAVPRAPVMCGARPCDYGPFRSVSTTAADNFWTTMASSPATATVTISPADLYSSSGGASRLSCNELAPVVRRTAVYLDTDGFADVDLGSIGMHVLGHAAAPDAAVSFPLAGTTLALDVEDPTGVTLSLPALNGDLTSVLAKFGPSPAELGIGAGISPFTSFQLDMRPFQSGDPAAALADAGAVLLVFEVERRVSSALAQVPGICQ